MPTTSHVISWIVTRGPALYTVVVDGQLTRTRSPGEVASFVEYLTFFCFMETPFPPFFFPWRLDVILHTAFAGHRYRSFADIDGFGSDGPGRDMGCLRTQPLTSRGYSSLQLVYRCTI